MYQTYGKCLHCKQEPFYEVNFPLSRLESGSRAQEINMLYNLKKSTILM